VSTHTLAELEGLVVTTAATTALARAELRRRRNLSLLEAGVTLEDPDSTWVGYDSTLEPGAVVRPFCIVEGRSHVARGAVVGPSARLEHATVETLATVLDHCLVRESTVGASAVVGPFAHLRPESLVGQGAKVGNFVELKKTRLGPGSKAPHLSYLGDSTIGARVNVGAGTITCNYDGAHKHPTQLDDDAFIGSNSTLVAPVHVGAGAYVAAGSTITSDVPADALGVARSRQVVKDGWAARRRTRQPRHP
jgi:bifunctional UDP-N-acetylglucosamine pyrophosphorylase/glucosamine-1-phosphate N-acetyltransferase